MINKKIKNKEKSFRFPLLSQNEKKKREFNEKGFVQGFPHGKGIPKLPLPGNLSQSLKTLESRLYYQIDEFYPISSIEFLTKSQYMILGGGVKNNMRQLLLNDNIWNNIIQFSNQLPPLVPIVIYVPFNYRIHLEGLRLMTGKSLMDILYLGEINVQNEFDKDDFKMYSSICDRIFEMYEKNQELDLTTLSLKDLNDGQFYNS